MNDENDQPPVGTKWLFCRDHGRTQKKKKNNNIHCKGCPIVSLAAPRNRESHAGGVFVSQVVQPLTAPTAFAHDSY